MNNKNKRLPKISNKEKLIKIIQVLLYEDWVETGDFAWKTGARSKPVSKTNDSTKKNFDLFADQLKELEDKKIIISKKDHTKKWKIIPTIYSLNKKNWETVLFIYKNIPDSQDYILKNNWTFDLIYTQKIKGISDINVKSDIKIMLKLSPTFYQFAMEFSNLKEMAELYYKCSILYKFDVLDRFKPEVKKILLDRKQKFAFHELFLFSVFCDKAKNLENSAAFILLKEIKKRSAEDEAIRMGEFSLLLKFLTTRAIFELERKEPRQIQKLKDLVEKCDQLVSYIQSVATVDKTAKKKFGDLIKTFNEIDTILGVNKTLSEQYFVK
jgi:hypothetical protein